MPRTETPAILHTSTQTRTVNEAKSPNSFLFNTIYPRRRWEIVNSGTIELAHIYRERQIVPFVQENGKAIMVPGSTHQFATVKAPNIRISHPLNIGAMWEKRYPGMSMFPTTGQKRQGLNAYIARQLRHALLDPTDDTEEYMTAMMLRGQITYVSEDESVFQINYQRPASHNTVAATLWTAAGADIRKNFMDANQLLDDAVDSQATDVILGSDAADAFLANTAQQDLLDKMNYDIGRVTTQNTIQSNGALFLGRVHGIRVWRYTRTVKDASGTSIPLIRPNYAEFIANNDMSQFVMYYAAIPEVVNGRPTFLPIRRFSKSWVENDPPTYMGLLHTRPLPFVRRAGATVSMQVTA